MCHMNQKYKSLALCRPEVAIVLSKTYRRKTCQKKYEHNICTEFSAGGGKNEFSTKNYRIHRRRRKKSFLAKT